MLDASHAKAEERLADIHAMAAVIFNDIPAKKHHHVVTVRAVTGSPITRCHRIFEIAQVHENHVILGTNIVHAVQALVQTEAAHRHVVHMIRADDHEIVSRIYIIKTNTLSSYGQVYGQQTISISRDWNDEIHFDKIVILFVIFWLNMS